MNQHPGERDADDPDAGLPAREGGQAGDGTADGRGPADADRAASADADRAAWADADPAASADADPADADADAAATSEDLAAAADADSAGAPGGECVDVFGYPGEAGDADALAAAAALMRQAAVREGAALAAKLRQVALLVWLVEVAARRRLAASPRVSTQPDDLQLIDSAVTGEVMAVYGISTGPADRLIFLARRLTGVHQDTLTALEQGRLDETRARVLAEATLVCTDRVAREVEAIVLPAAGTSPWDQAPSPRAWRARVERAVITADPRAAQQRRERAVAERGCGPGRTGTAPGCCSCGPGWRTSGWPNRSSTASRTPGAPAMSRAGGSRWTNAGWTPPSTCCAGSATAVTCPGWGCAGTGRSGWCCTPTPCSVTAQPPKIQASGAGWAGPPRWTRPPRGRPRRRRSPAARPVCVFVTDPHRRGQGRAGPALRGGEHQPDQPHQHAAAAAAAGARRSTDRYTPTVAITEHVQARNPRCGAFDCARIARHADLDHDQPWPRGPTEVTNLCPRCRRHHELKTRGLLTTGLQPDGTVHTRMLTGITLTTRPEPLPGHASGEGYGPAKAA